MSTEEEEDGFPPTEGANEGARECALDDALESVAGPAEAPSATPTPRFKGCTCPSNLTSSYQCTLYEGPPMDAAPRAAPTLLAEKEPKLCARGL
jgi:hypothetical protein